jgi:hypothetical protein
MLRKVTLTHAHRLYVFGIFLSVPLLRLWPSVGSSLKIIQTVASVMEILHAAFGWVRSSVSTNIMQALARHMSIWLVVDLNFSILHTNSSILDGVVGPQWNTKEVWFGATVFAWASIEVIRYSMYATEELRCTPSILKFLRYNAFIIFYPVGLVGEISGLLLALEAYKSGLCPPMFPSCATNSVGLYVAYFYLLTALPGRCTSPALVAIPLTIFFRFPQALYAHVFAARQTSCWILQKERVASN